jgi:hypothetical protein
MDKKKGRLDTKRIKRLNEIEFIWDARSHEWEQQFHALEAYQKRHGDCLVPYKTQLGKWVGTQRMDKKKGRLDAKRIKRLNEIGFVWEAKK